MLNLKILLPGVSIDVIWRDIEGNLVINHLRLGNLVYLYA